MDAHLLAVTGWSPSELDAVDRKRLELYMLYMNVVNIVQTGKGSFMAD